MVRPLARGEGRRLRASLIEKRDVYVAQLGGLRRRIEIRRIGEDVRALDAVGGDVVRHVEQHLVGRIGCLYDGGRFDARLACTNREDVEKNRREKTSRSGVQSVHAAPAFIRSCRCTIPTTRRPPSKTGSAMMPWRSITCTAAPASTSGVVVF